MTLVVWLITCLSGYWVYQTRQRVKKALKDTGNLTFEYIQKRNGHDCVEVIYKCQRLFVYKWIDGHRAEPRTRLYEFHELFKTYTKGQYREIIKQARVDGVAQPRKQ